MKTEDKKFGTAPLVGAFLMKSRIVEINHKNEIAKNK